MMELLQLEEADIVAMLNLVSSMIASCFSSIRDTVYHVDDDIQEGEFTKGQQSNQECSYDSDEVSSESRLRMYELSEDLLYQPHAMTLGHLYQ